jgi:phosphoribosyl-AMP cyclohydrolase
MLGGLFILSEELLMDWELDFEKMNGLLPAVVQDWRDGEVLMVGFMNREALEQTLRNGYVTFFSRTRNQLWMKGESSGNRLRVLSAQTDCDRDTLLVRVEVEGAGVVCHRGTRSCFTEWVPVPSERVAEESR